MDVRYRYGSHILFREAPKRGYDYEHSGAARGRTCGVGMSYSSHTIDVVRSCGIKSRPVTIDLSPRLCWPDTYEWRCSKASPFLRYDLLAIVVFIKATFRTSSLSPSNSDRSLFLVSSHRSLDTTIYHYCLHLRSVIYQDGHKRCKRRAAPI